MTGKLGEDHEIRIGTAKIVGDRDQVDPTRLFPRKRDDMYESPAMAFGRQKPLPEPFFQRRLNGPRANFGLRRLTLRAKVDRGNALLQRVQATQGDSPSAAFVEARQPFAVCMVLRAHGYSICSLAHRNSMRVWM